MDKELEDIVTYIKDYVERDYNIPKNEDILSFNFLKSGYIDSVAIFAFLANIEEDFNIDISDEDRSNSELSTIGGLAKFIYRKQKNNGKLS